MHAHCLNRATPCLGFKFLTEEKELYSRGPYIGFPLFGQPDIYQLRFAGQWGIGKTLRSQSLL